MNSLIPGSPWGLFALREREVLFSALGRNFCPSTAPNAGPGVGTGVGTALGTCVGTALGQQHSAQGKVLEPEGPEDPTQANP